MSLMYTATNESLDAIVCGLDINRDDDVLAVCGSGDQAFAISEFANSVTAIDIHLEQIKYAAERRRYLVQERYDCFYDLTAQEGDNVRVRNYFMTRVRRIREKASSIKFRLFDLRNALSLGKFSKIYVSNAMGYSWRARDGRELNLSILDFMTRALDCLPVGGLFYVTNGNRVKDILDNSGAWKRLPVREEKRLTTIANNFERNNNSGLWYPLVLKKTGEER